MTFNLPGMSGSLPELSDKQKRDLGGAGITRRIKEDLKRIFPGCKFSVILDSYSGGKGVNISLMSSDRQIVRRFEDLPGSLIEHLKALGYSVEQIKTLQGARYSQLNEYTLRGDYNAVDWCNGVYLTEAGFNLLKRVVEVADYYNYNHSDPMTDYFCVNFYLHIALGKYDKPFIDGASVSNLK